MSVSYKVLRNMARLRDRLQSMLPVKQPLIGAPVDCELARQPRIGAPVDCELAVTVDEVNLKELADALGPENMAASVRAFARDLNETADKMRTQLAAGEDSGVRRSAHRMKGLLSQFGASELAQLAAKLEATESDEMRAPATRLLDCVPLAIKAVQRATGTETVIA